MIIPGYIVYVIITRKTVWSSVETTHISSNVVHSRNTNKIHTLYVRFSAWKPGPISLNFHGVDTQQSKQENEKAQ